jgi:2-C-methyl-D-erythritol 4-phosphate cytidylyltransferase
MKYYAIIVGGGSGKRMKHLIAKQFLLLKNKPIMMHTLSAFHCATVKPSLIVVLHPDLHEQWKALCITYNFDIPHQLVNGGEERFHSVKNGLMAIKGDGIVAVHDAVRPLVSAALITKAYEIAELEGNAVPCIKPSDSIRKTKDNQSKILNRDQIVLVQTPQTFQISQLTKGYQQPYKSKFTDDASVVEKAGFKINLIEGERNNLKITYPEDLALANLLVQL